MAFVPMDPQHCRACAIRTSFAPNPAATNANEDDETLPVIKVYPSGDIQSVGSYNKDGKRVGMWQEWSEWGTMLYRGEFEYDGSEVKVGLWMEQTVARTVRTGEEYPRYMIGPYTNGQRVGLWTEWNGWEDSSLLGVVDYGDGSHDPPLEMRMDHR